MHQRRLARAASIAALVTSGAVAMAQDPATPPGRPSFLDAPPSDGPAPPTTREELEAFEKIQSGWNLGLIDVKPWAQPVASGILGVGWVTASPAVGAVEWTQDEADDAQATWHRASHGEDGLITANTTAQRALIRGWDPVRPLRFRVGSRPVTAFQRNVVALGPEVWSETFRIGPLADASGATSFVVFNDTHNRVQNFPILLDAAGGGVRFAVFNGDIVQNPMQASEVVENLLLPMTWFTSLSMPVLYVRGNHETSGAYARSLKQHLCLPGNRYYGALDVGAARLVFLDGGTGAGDDWLFSGGDYIAEQCEWLEREVASDAYRSARWRIAILHAPPDWRKLGKEKMSCDRHVNQRFAPILDRFPPHAVVGGHTHRAEVLDPPSDETAGFRFPVFIGGAPDLGRATAIRVDLDANSLSIAILRADGTPVARRTWE